MSHSMAQPLRWGNGTYAHFARGDCDTLILLVHGFGGRAEKTWKGLQSLINGPDETRSSDIISYGYNSTRAPAANSAILLKDFIEDILGNSDEWQGIVARVVGHDTARDYSRVIIVAHSLGAAVARRMILDSIESGSEWPKKARLILFAPAHMGARLLDRNLLAGLSGIGSLGGLVTLLLAGMEVYRPVLDDLATGSPFLTRLVADTQAYLDRGWEEPLKAAHVLFGEKEIVVNVEPRFCDDPLHKVWPGHDHTSICKDVQAAQFVRSCLG